MNDAVQKCTLKRNCTIKSIHTKIKGGVNCGLRTLALSKYPIRINGPTSTGAPAPCASRVPQTLPRCVGKRRPGGRRGPPSRGLGQGPTGGGGGWSVSSCSRPAPPPFTIAGGGAGKATVALHSLLPLRRPPFCDVLKPETRPIEVSSGVDGCKFPQMQVCYFC